MAKSNFKRFDNLKVNSKRFIWRLIYISEVFDTQQALKAKRQVF